MIPAAFDYVRADSADEAIAAPRRARRRGQAPRRRPLAAAADEAAPGHARRCWSTSAASPTSPTSATEGDHVAIGAPHPPPRRRDSRRCCRRRCRCWPTSAGHVGDPQVRHRGTLGGSLAHGDPASDLPAVVLALGGTLVRQGPERRPRRSPPPTSSPGFLETALAPDELLTEVRVPKVPGAGWSFQKFNRRAQDWAIVGVAAVAERRHRRGAGEHGLDAAPGHRGRGRRWPAGASAADAAAVADEGTEPAGRPQRHRGVPPPPGQGARPPGAGGGRQAAVASRVASTTAPPTDVDDVPGRGARRPRPGDDLARRRAGEHGYLADEGLATVVFLALTLQRPLLLEGDAGSARPRWPRCSAAWTGGELLRLQCYEGIDVAQAVYEWDHARQLLHLRAAEAAGAAARPSSVEDELYAERFLVRRPLLAGGRRRRGAAAGAADRRGRPGRRRVRGLPARGPVRLGGHRPRARHVPRRRRRRWWSSRRTAPATCTTP